MGHIPSVSLSVYRGPSSKGIGEGPGQPVTQGEQYLDANPPLDRDADLLDGIRPWMSLDSDPADHQKLNDRLEAWSCCVYRNWQLVARLTSAGTFGPRAAYFAHGRLWAVDAGPGFDPGLHIGRSEVFESPWRDDNPGKRVPELAPSLAGVDQIKAEADVAALFLAHLLQSCVRGRPLVVLAPLSEFAVGAPLHHLLSFARGALPVDLRQACRVRIYTRTPELFLRGPGAALIAMPDDVQERAQSVRRDARVIDRQGRTLSGEPLETVAREYAGAVLERALHIPAGLTRFSERFRDRSRRTGGLPAERDVHAVQITYNLAFALAGSAENLGDLARNYLPRIAHKLGTAVDWQQLITTEEWWTFPLEPVLDLLLMDPQALSPGMRELQKAAERAAALGRAVEQGVLDPSRVLTLLKDAPGSRLAAIAQELLQVRGLIEDNSRWGNVLKLLLEELRRLPSVPPDLASLLVRSLVHSGKLRHPWLLDTMASQLIEYQDLLKALSLDELLKLAGRLETERGLERVFDFVDISIGENLQSTTDALTRTGWWTAWRKKSQLMARDSEKRRRAAQAWLTSRSWRGEGAREATREDWNRVMEDLPAGLPETDRLTIWGGGGGPRRLWPWIPPFEEDQLADLAERAPGLPALAELAEAVSDDPFQPDVGEPVYRHLLRHSRLKRSFQKEDALGWLMAIPPAGLPHLDLADSLRLWQMAGSRVERAVQARLDSICHCLETNQQEEAAILGADQPDLWGMPRFVEALAFWMDSRGSVDRIGRHLAKKIDQQIAAEPSRRPTPVNQALVWELMKLQLPLKRAASLLDTQLPGEVEQESFMESVIGALATGAHNHHCWRVLAAKIESDSTGRHPLSAIAERVQGETGDRRAALVRTGWSTFEAAAHTEPWLTSMRPEQMDLPVFDLAASLSEPGGLGSATLRVIFSASASQRSKLEWWETLLRGLFEWRRHPPLDCPEDRRDVAIALVVRLLEDLQSQERQVFWSALGRRAGNLLEWDLLVGAQ